MLWNHTVTLVLPGVADPDYLDAYLNPDGAVFYQYQVPMFQFLLTVYSKKNFNGLFHENFRKIIFFCVFLNEQI